MRRERRHHAQVVIAIVLAVTSLTGCGQPSGDRWRRAGPWAEPHAQTPMPAAAPDDPGAYRGVRFRIARPYGLTVVEAAGQSVPWLRASIANGYGNVIQDDGPLFGYQQVTDGRRRMVWFFRFLGPAFGTPRPPEPERAILDVLVLPGEPEWGLKNGCAFDPVIIDGDHAWRLNQTTGRFEPVDPDKVPCPED